MAKGEKLNTDETLQNLISSIENFEEGESSFGKYRLHTFNTNYSVKDFTNLIFNPILGLNNDLIKKISLKSASSKEWLKRVSQLEKIYFSISSVKSFDTCKKTVQLSIKLMDNGTGSINDTKPIILIHLYWICQKYQFN